jgi:hypothetical protein
MKIMVQGSGFRVQGSENRKGRKVIRKFIFLTSVICFLASAIGCDAFVRKFTRKPKKDKMQKEEMVLAPEEYKSTMSKEELYRQYFVFWKSWHGELIESLARSSSQKKILSCIEQANKNLIQLRPMLNAEKQAKLDVYLGQIDRLHNSIKGDVYGSLNSTNRQQAEQLRSRILRDFSYSKVKDSLI